MHWMGLLRNTKLEAMFMSRSEKIDSMARSPKLPGSNNYIIVKNEMNLVSSRRLLT